MLGSIINQLETERDRERELGLHSAVRIITIASYL